MDAPAEREGADEKREPVTLLQSSMWFTSAAPDLEDAPYKSTMLFCFSRCSPDSSLLLVMLKSCEVCCSEFKSLLSFRGLSFTS